MLPRLLSLGLLTAGLVQADTFRDSSSQTDALDPHGTIRIDDTNGSIAIKTWDRPEVSIQVEKRASTEAYLKEIQVDIESSPHDLSIRTTFPRHLLSWLWNGSGNGSVHLVLMVPATVNLDEIALVNGGITIDGVRGSIAAHTVNGGLHVAGVRDNAHLSTVNGSIRTEVPVLGTDSHLHLSTINGSIVISLARDANAVVNASTINGGTSCELPIQLTEETRRHDLHGVIGAGGGSISATTVNGSVHFQTL
jgi:DUF4097 and DUF4098 domain-containing protein YvlB